jgi:glycyl-tRNA synthetase (class II)
VTVRERDSMAQERIALDQVEGWLAAERALAGVLSSALFRLARPS